MGMFVAQQVILSRINPASADERASMTAEQLQQVTASDLDIIKGPYVAIAGVILILFIIMLITNMPKKYDQDHRLNVGDTLKRLFKNKRYYEGVIAQFFYVGAQIMCWTFIIHYGTMELGMTEAEAQGYNIVAMIIFASSRFITTYLMKYFRSGQMLMVFAIGGMALVLGTIFIQGMVGLYCLVGVSACMSLMFPTIYGIALRGLGADAKFGAAGLIMAIVGGSVMPPLQGAIIDLETVFSYPAVRVSFVLPLISFIVITIYGRRTEKIHLKNV
jgi:FHS family L-fucose permease-like MFS transporter